MSELRSTIVRLLSTMASAKEIKQYLERFSQVDAARFAVVKVGGAVLRDELDALVSSLAFLQQVGLTPIVVHGAGPQIDEQVAAVGLAVLRRDGLRVASEAVLSVVRRVTLRENLRLVEALQSVGVRAASLTSGVFESVEVDRAEYGLIGRVTRVETQGVKAVIDAQSIPVVASLGETAGGQILDVDTDGAAAALVETLEPYKIIVLTSTGGLLDGEGRIIDSINLSTEYEPLRGQPWLPSEDRVRLEQVHDLLMRLPPSSSVSITRPDALAKELFTHRGSGTLVRRGERIHCVEGWGALERSRLAAVIESGFGRALAPDYFEQTRPWRVYVSEHYRAALVLTREHDIPHLDKFVVMDGAQGEGLGRAAWQVMREQNPRLFWRSRPGNAINDFYFAQADGCIKGEQWNVFWYGLERFEDVRMAVEHCRARPASLEDAASSSGDNGTHHV